MGRLHDVVIDCRHPASLARFWAAAMEDYAVAPYDEAELKRLRDRGITNPEDDPTVVVEAGPGMTPRFMFMRVPEPKSVKNRLHIDLHTDDIPTEVDRLTSLGARVLARHETHVMLADPEGNEFCLTH